MNKRKFHLIGLPTLDISDSTLHSPIVNIVKNMIEMLKELGEDVIYYGVENDELECPTETLVSKEDYEEYASTKSANDLAIHASYDQESDYYVNAKNKLRGLLRNNLTSQTEDFILLTHPTMGVALQESVDAGYAVIEYAVSYPYRFAEFAIYPSYYQEGVVRALDENKGYNSVKFYDFVIPHAINSKDYLYDKNAEKDYIVFLGRLQYNKGFGVLENLAKFTDLKIKIAGAPTPDTADLLKHYIEDYDMEYVGVVGKEDKKELLSGAAALVAPSTIFETYHLASVEAMMSGVPVICTDGAGFSENIVHGVTGFRCRTLGDFKQGMEKIDTLDREAIHDYAYNRFSTDKIKFRYQDAFNKIQDVKLGNGWYNTDLLTDIALNTSHFKKKN